MIYIYFGMSKELVARDENGHSDRFVQAFDQQSAYAVFDALTRRFVRVDMIDASGNLLCRYDNI